MRTWKKRVHTTLGTVWYVERRFKVPLGTTFFHVTAHGITVGLEMPPLHSQLEWVLEVLMHFTWWWWWWWHKQHVHAVQLLHSLSRHVCAEVQSTTSIQCFRTARMFTLSFSIACFDFANTKSQTFDVIKPQTQDEISSQQIN